MKTCFGALALSCVSFAMTIIGATSASAADCESLVALSLPHATVTAAQSVTGGSFTPPATTTPLTGLPPFCRVTVTSTPTSDSIINLEVWIPTGGSFNGKYEQLGCGGFCGSIGYSGLAEAIKRGYASAATNDGNPDPNGSATFALGHPEKVIDFGYRALKETTDIAKTVITSWSGSNLSRSYFAGCSDGGREALMEAQRFPDDFDGIIVGSPANAWTHLFAGFIWNEQALLDDPASYVPPSLLSIVSAAALAQCAGQDGGVSTDPFLNDPRDCHFDPASVQCQSGQDPSTCLTPAQVDTVRKIYAGPHDPITGALIYPGYEPGSESNAADWPLWIVGTSRAADLTNASSIVAVGASGEALQMFFANSFFADFVYQNPEFDFRTFGFPGSLEFADEGVGPIINSIDPDLRPFRDHGGKMIHYVGWADSAIAPINSVNYYNQVKQAVSGGSPGYQDLQSFYRLFMVPGMAHCGGGPGPNAFGNGVNGPVLDPAHDLLMALDRWVQQGVAPDQFIATKYVNDQPTSGIAFQRPLCPFPQAAQYNGSGDPNSASSFSCVTDERDHDPRDQDLSPGGGYAD